MDTTARTMVKWVQSSITTLALNPAYGTKNAVYEEIASLAGVSISSVQKLYDGRSANPRADTLDQMITAIKAMNRKIAA